MRNSCAMVLVVGSVAILSGGCERGPQGPLAPAAGASGVAVVAAQPAERCMNVSADGDAQLSFAVTLPDGTTGLGADWSPISLGSVAGEMASVVLSEESSGSRGQGALHLTLKHAFRTASGDYFLTEDRAVCAPAGPNPLTCRVNDVLTLVTGTGIFENAGGSLRNHGTIDFLAGTLQFSLRGRICGDGL